jgi:transcriptional regulator with XRE-family HTH domain
MSSKGAVDSLIGNRIRLAREETGLSVTAFVAAIGGGGGQSRPVHYRREAGTVATPHDVLARVAVFTQKPISWFFQDIVARIDGSARRIEDVSPGIQVTPALLTMIHRFSALSERQQAVVNMVMKEFQPPPPDPVS